MMLGYEGRVSLNERFSTIFIDIMMLVNFDQALALNGYEDSLDGYYAGDLPDGKQRIPLS